MSRLLTAGELAAIADRAKDLPEESWSEEKLYYLLRHGRKRKGYWDRLQGELPEECFADFLVNARTDIPALLADRECLLAEIAALSQKGHHSALAIGTPMSSLTIKGDKPKADASTLAYGTPMSNYKTRKPKK